MLLNGLAASAAGNSFFTIPTMVESGKNEPGLDPRNHLPQRLFVVPGPTYHGPVYPALVRWHAGRLERVPAVLPGCLAGWIRVCALAGVGKKPPHSGLGAHGVPGRVTGVTSRYSHPA